MAGFPSLSNHLYGMPMMGHPQLPRVGAPMLLPGMANAKHGAPHPMAYPSPYGGFLMMDASGQFQRMMPPGFDAASAGMMMPQVPQQFPQQMQVAPAPAPAASTPKSAPRAPANASRANAAQSARESAANKRNKFFYKELREHLENKLRPSIGWLSDIFFVMDPKLHVGPINRDGTFEKRVRLHFIEWLELKNVNLWICWGILLDQTRQPVFRESSNLYRIPGNQSSMFKTNRSFQGWAVADEEQRRVLRTHATEVRGQLEGRWDGYSTEAARRMIKVDPFELPAASSPPDALLDLPLELRSGKPTTRSDTAKQEHVVDVRPAEEIAAETWEAMGFKVPARVEDADGETEADAGETIVWGESFTNVLARTLGLTTHREEILKVFKLMTTKDNKINYDLWLTAVKRFGFGQRMIAKMCDVLSTGAFNGEMSTEDAENELLHREAGSYLIRYSRSSPEHFCICWRWKDKIEQMNKISNDPAGGIVVDVGTEPLRFANWKAFIAAAEIMSKNVIANSKTEYSFAEHHVPLEKLMNDERYTLRSPQRRSRRPARSYAALAGHTSGDEEEGFEPSSESVEHEENSDGDGSFHLPNSNVPSPHSDDSIGPSSPARVAYEDKYHAPFPLPSATKREPSPSSTRASPASPAPSALPTLPRQAVPQLPMNSAPFGIPMTMPVVASAAPGLSPTEIKNTLLQYVAQLVAQGKIEPSRFSKWALQLSNERFASLGQLATLHSAFKEHPDLWISAAGPILDVTN
jgi:hypothetical protein